VIRPLTELSHAVFLSYASQDAEAAQRICEALRSAGVEVWFDRSELRGGDIWDQRIRREVHDCELFLPVISANTTSRREGYFRLEWDLADQRTHMMARDRTFIIPVCLDATAEAGADVPESFQRAQWTRLPRGETSVDFVERVRRLLSPAPPDARAKVMAPGKAIPVATTSRRTYLQPRTAALLLISAIAIAALGYLALERFVRSKAAMGSATTTSIAVLPLTNDSSDANQQYFSDGLSEDLITALSQFPGLKVIGRTSSFKFRNSKDDIQTIGAKLGVAHLLEGSVRHAGDMVRVSAELIDTSDGSTQWSERYDRPYKDFFVLQDDLTRAVVGALSAHLLPRQRTSARQTDRPPSGSLEAYNAVLEGKYHLARHTEADTRNAIERFTRATRLDTRYAFAWSLLSSAWTNIGAFHVDLAAAPAAYTEARAASNTSLSLASDLTSAHIARGLLLEMADLDWAGAEAEYRRALELAPEDGDAAAGLARILSARGQMERAVELNRQALTTDPLNSSWYSQLAEAFFLLNRLEDAEAAIRKSIELQSGGVRLHYLLTDIEIRRGDFQAALAAAQQEPTGSVFRHASLAKALQSSGDRAAANAALASLLAKGPSWDPYDTAQVYAMRNDSDKTFEWLERAWSYRDPSLHALLHDPFIARFKDDPRFIAYSRKVGLALQE
jgi:TolB-like protein/tetratricopeptide (TPR) repeat protein